MYHSICDRSTDAWGTAVSPATFRSHVELVCQKYEVLSLGEIARRASKATLPKRWIAITFDDGYADNLHQAKPLLDRFGVPATVFVVSGKVGSTAEFWWDEVERVLLGDCPLPDVLQLNDGARSLTWTISEPPDPGDHPRESSVWRAWMPGPVTARQHAYRGVHELMLTLDSDRRERVLRQLRAWAQTSSQARAEYRPLTSDELRELGSGSAIEIGSHTVTHTPLHTLTSDAVADELETSKRSLEATIRRPVHALSYPFGSYVAQTVPQVAVAGYQYACGSLSHDDVCRMQAPFLRGIIDVELPLTARFEMPRVMIEDWTAAELGSRLSMWFDA